MAGKDSAGSTDRPKQTSEQASSYRPPEIWVLGRLAELTAGLAGTGFDMGSNASVTL